MICKPLGVRSILTQSRILKIIVFIWLISIAINLPLVFMAEYKLEKFLDEKIDHKCSVNSNEKWRQYYIITITFIIYLLIGVFLLLMFMNISYNLKKSTHFLMISITKNSQIKFKTSLNNKNTDEFRILNVQNDVCLKNIQQSDQKYNLEKYIKPRKQLILMLIYVILAFYLCLFPLKLWNIIYMLIGHKRSFTQVIKLRHFWYINILARVFFYINSSINVLLYYRFR